MMHNMDVVDHIWFSQTDGGPVGIVVVEDKLKKTRKAYIGKGEGNNTDIDITSVLNRGCRIHLSGLKNIINQLEGKEAY